MTEHSIFLALLEIDDPSQRLAYLDRACAGDPALRGQVEQLLKAHEEPGRFMDRPAAALVTAIDEPLVSERPGMMIGPYKLLEQIGEGGIHYLNVLAPSHLVANPDGTDALIVHANPLNQEDTIFPTATDKELERLLGDVPSTIGTIAFGHLHIAYQRQWRNLLLLDAGSCGLPRDEDHRASYGVLTWQDEVWQAEHHRVEYDVPRMIDQLRTCGMPHIEKRIKILLEARYS